MNAWIASTLTHFLQAWGYWTVFLCVFIESAGIPSPGETILIVASVFARTHHSLSIVGVGLAGFFGAVTGDNLGFLVGRWGGRRLLKRYQEIFHLKEDHLRKGESIIKRHGGKAVFFARFVATLRILSGPVAGTLRMPWPRFLVFNALGAACWVALITTLGYAFGHALEPLVRHAGWAIAAFTGAAILWWWFKLRKKN